MRPVAQAAASAAKQWTRHALPKPSRLAATSLSAPTPEPQRRYASAGSSTHQPTSFDSPFGQSKQPETDFDKIPNFKAYMSKSSENTNRVFQYFVVGTMGLLTAAGAKATVQDVLAMAKVEVDLETIPEGRNVIIKWRGKPVFVRHRTESEIKDAESVNIQTLRDPQADSDRVKKPEWLVMLGVCTHLGCVPIGEAGDFGGWFCPCHGSHYDISGRVRKGPAPLNLEVPEYDFPEDGKLVIG